MKKLSVAVVVMAASMGAAHAAPTGVKPVAKASSVTAAAEALSKGDTLEALTRADEALRADPKNAWAHYNRAAALAGLNRTDEAVAAYDQAAGAFAATDKRGKSLALWGKAHLLYRTGKCTQAREAFDAYTKFVGSSDPQATELASHRATTCHQAAPEAEATAMPSTKADATTVAGTPGKSEEAKSALPSLTKPEAPAEAKSAMPSLSK